MKKRLSLFAALCGLFVLITAPEQAAASCRASVLLCGRLIIPGLFPFFIISGLLNALGFPQLLSRLLGNSPQKLFHVSGAGFSAFLLGIFGGYPLGAAAVSDMLDKEIISPSEAEKLLAFCNNSGPAFIIGAVGSGVFNNPMAGLMLYIIHIFSSLLIGFMLRGKSSYSAALPDFEPLALSSALSSSVKSAVINILNVCGFVMCFGVFTGIIERSAAFAALLNSAAAEFKYGPDFIRAFIYGLIELGSGIGAMEGFAADRINLALAAFILGFGGMSVHFQTLALFADKNINSAPHFLGRCLNAVISSLLAYFLPGLI